ncbi:hypothetical protein BC829DRAFT_490137 [Chytridium lagenaria]|nr:hypothetical protein BC829DRAFT_490137 [Chytridium lagenaria]
MGKRSRGRMRLSTLLAIAFLTPTVLSQDTCTPYKGSVCSAQVNWTVVSTQSSATESFLEKQVNSDYFRAIRAFDPKCADAWQRWLCTNYFQDCGSSVTLNGTLFFRKPCSSSCTDFLSACTPTLTNTVYASNLLDCSLITILEPPLTANSTIIRPNCYGSTALLPARKPQCPAPLVPKPDNLTEKEQNLSICIDSMGCCLGCPSLEAFYAKESFTTAFKVLGPIRIISTFLGLAVFLSYLLLPEKRTHPRVMVLFASFSVLAFQIISILPVFGDRRELSCAYAGKAGPGLVVTASQSTNMACAIQGSMYNFFGLSILLWVFMLILNMHLQTVWGSAVMGRYYWLIHIICWGIPTSFSIAVISTDSVRFAHGFNCLVDPRRSDAFLFYPAATIIMPAIIIHLCTSSWIAWASRKRRPAKQEILDLTEFFEYTAVVGSIKTVGAATGATAYRLGSMDLARQSLDVRQSGEGGDGDGRSLASFNTGAGLTQKTQEIEIVGVFSVQGRIIMMALAVTTVLLIVWTVYAVDIPQIYSFITPQLTFSKSPFETWLICITETLDQSACHAKIASSIPSFFRVIAMETVISIPGVMCFFIFVINSTLVQEWRALILETIGRVRVWKGGRGRRRETEDEGSGSYSLNEVGRGARVRNGQRSASKGRGRR